MSGKHRGVQARVRQIIPEAIYVHCKAHNLNLAIVHACKEPLVRNIMDTIQQISFCFNESGKRTVFFRDELAENDEVKEDMGRRAKIQTLCDTRWASRCDALYTFLTAYPVVVSSLKKLERNGDSKARSFICCISKFDFLIALVVVEHILQIIHPLSIMLQAKTFDLIEAVQEAKVVNNKRNDDVEWEELFDKATSLAAKVDEIPTIPRGAARQQHRANVPAATPKEYWKRALYYPFLDHILQELEDRLAGNEARFQPQYSIPTKLDGLTDDISRHDLTAVSFDVFHIEVTRWKSRWAIVTNQKPGTLVETLKSTNQMLYPNVYVCLAILATMPVATATAERSFSVMRRVKTYLRSTMTTDRLSSLALMHAYKHTEIDVQQVINVFADRKSRRLAFLFRQ
ncbi:52 kDa repressor of the inhibitor of the protein kinase-like [Pecten maximus]|uniref:52 kDa repressor of the inhibitor of the protein kinase-like n=1 Tax=Pecten maximus TaxID=6579 RepID=UPI0014591166|nr:52 kDa repressor of the inhibitor of the protein kinase-like [Pecten maximus]